MGSYICTFEDGSEALVHYGVLGMRWGVRHDKEYKSDKAKIKNAYRQELERAKQSYKRSGNESALETAEGRAEAKRRKAINDAKVKTANRLYSTNSEETNRRIQTASTGKTLAKSALLGSYGALHYTRARGEGKGRGRSAVRGVLARAIPGSGGLDGIAGLHNYAVDRAARKRGQKSGKTNRRYIS